MAIDRSKVPPQGAYRAGECPVICQLDVLQPTEPSPKPDFYAMLGQQGDGYEASLFEVILASHPDAVDVEEDEAKTVAAIEARVPIILSPKLPIDEAGRRIGKPDILIAAPAGGYRPVDVKSHKALGPIGNGKTPALVSTPQALAYESALPDEEYKQAIIEKDDLQLAHYQRILEAHGWEAKDGRLAAILGSEGLCVWIDLDRVTRQKPSKTQGTKRRDAMERYAFEFGFRLDIMATAQQHLVDPSIPLLVEPWACDDCKSCKWRGYCLPLLEERQDASLLPHMKTLQRSRYGKAGLETMQAIAGLDPTTAALVRNGVKVAELLEFADDALPDGPLGEDKKMRRRRKQLAELKAVGIETFGRATDRLCRRTARIATDATAGHIDEARAALGPSAVYRRRGVSTITIPRADVEIDIDMESISKPSVTYLWGVLVQGHPDPSLNRYHHFSRFDTPTPELDSAVSGEFWFWLSQVIADCEARGLSLKIYCYHSPAEATALRRFAGSAGLEVEVERLVNSDLWVDMEKVFKDHFATGSGVGLKKVAILAGYAWDAEDAGGTESMLRFATAVESEDDDERKAAVDWLLRYNRGDVEATAHLRDWLTDNAGSIPPIESLDAMFDAPG